MSKEFDRSAMEKHLKILLENQEFLEAAMVPIAQMLKSKLDALVQAGFTRQEAMEIIKARGLDA